MNAQPIIKLGVPKGSLEEATINLFDRAGWKIRKHTRNYFWNGYCRFGVGFNTWKHIALAVNASSLSDATAL